MRGFVATSLGPLLAEVERGQNMRSSILSTEHPEGLIWGPQNSLGFMQMFSALSSNLLLSLTITGQGCGSLLPAAQGEPMGWLGLGEQLLPGHRITALLVLAQ